MRRRPPQRDATFLLWDTPTDGYRLRGLGVLLGGVLGVSLAAGLLAPLLYLGVQAGAQALDPTPAWLAWLADHPFSRYLDRVRLLLGIGFLFALLRWTRLWGQLGYRRDEQAMHVMNRWLLVGMLTFLVPALLQLLMLGPVRVLWAEAPWLLVTALATGGVVSLIEEALFRGLVLRLCYTALPPLAANVTQALCFAALHFKGPRWPKGEAVELTTGLHLAVEGLWSFAVPFQPLKFLYLFLVGLILGFLTLRARSLWPAFGLHAAWVASLLFWSKGVSLSPANSNPWLGTERLVDGYLAIMILLALAGGLLYRYLRHGSRPHASHQPPA